MKYNVAFEVIKDDISEKKFEVIETGAHKEETVLNILKKKYAGSNIHVKYIHENKTAKNELK